MKHKFLILANVAFTFTSVFTAGIRAEVKATETVIVISGRIGVEGKTDSETMRKQVDSLLAKGVKNVKVKLNSEGGSVFDANEIVNELNRFESVKISVGALAASAGTYFLAKFYSSSKKNSQFMLHKPSSFIYGNESEVEGQTQLLKNLTSDYKKAYASKMKKTEDEIEAMWAKGDKWLTAYEARDLGLIDEIEDQDEAIDKTTAALLKKCGAPQAVINVQKSEEQNTDDFMKKEELISQLGLAADATDQQVIDALAEMKAAKKAADEARTDSAKNQKAKSEAVVMKAITAKKITAELKDHYVKLHMASPEATEAVLESLPVIPKLSDEIHLDGKYSAEVEAERKTWKLEDYLEQDPKAYEAMKKADPERAKRLEEAYFNATV